MDAGSTTRKPFIVATPLLVTSTRPRSARTAQEVICTARPLATGAALFLGDALALTLAGWVGYFLWSHVNSAIGLEFYLQLSPGLALWHFNLATTCSFSGLTHPCGGNQSCTAPSTSLIHSVCLTGLNTKDK